MSTESPEALHAGSRQKLLSFSEVCRPSSALMFALGVAATVVVTNSLEILSPRTASNSVKTPDRIVEQIASVKRSPDKKPGIVLSGVNGEAFAEGDIQIASARLASAFEQTSLTSAEIDLPKKLQVGDILKVTVTSGDVFSFKVARLAALCTADPARQPVPDVALVECDQRGRAEQWRYVIEAVTEPAGADRRVAAPRVL